MLKYIVLACLSCFIFVSFTDAQTVLRSAEDIRAIHDEYCMEFAQDVVKWIEQGKSKEEVRDLVFDKCVQKLQITLSMTESEVLRLIANIGITRSNFTTFGEQAGASMSRVKQEFVEESMRIVSTSSSESVRSSRFNALFDRYKSSLTNNEMEAVKYTSLSSFDVWKKIIQETPVIAERTKADNYEAAKGIAWADAWGALTGAAGGILGATVGAMYGSMGRALFEFF